MEKPESNAAEGLSESHARLLRYVREEAGPLYSYFRRATGDPESAHDLLQDTFMDAWRNLNLYDAARPFRNWIFRVGQNRLRNLLRRRRLELQWMRPLEEESPAAAFHGAEQPFEQAEVIERGLLRLSIEHRAVLLLRYQEGLSCAEAGDVLGITANAVSIQLHHARKRLKEVLEARAPEKHP